MEARWIHSDPVNFTEGCISADDDWGVDAGEGALTGAAAQIQSVISEVHTITGWEGWSVSGKPKHVCRPLLIITET